MWKNLVLYHLLRITTNSEESCHEAAKYFKCLPNVQVDDDGSAMREMIMLHGLLTKRGDVWCIQHGFDQVAVDITSETVGFRLLKHLIDPVYIFAEVPIPDPDTVYANFQEETSCEAPKAKLIVSENIYQLAYLVDSVEEKYSMLSDFFFLPVDQKPTVYYHLADQVFSKNLARCLGFMASAKIDPFLFSFRNLDLIEEYNAASVRNCKIDPYRMLSFLDMVGDELLLSENSAVTHFTSTWVGYLASYALVEGCSVWNIPGKSLAQIILKEVPHNFFPSYMLCWILSAEQQNEMVRDLLKCRNKKKSKNIRMMLIHFLCHGSGLKLKVIHNTVHKLMEEGLNEDELAQLTAGNSAAVVKSFLLSEYGLTL